MNDFARRDFTLAEEVRESDDVRPERAMTMRAHDAALSSSSAMIPRAATVAGAVACVLGRDLIFAKLRFSEIWGSPFAAAGLALFGNMVSQLQSSRRRGAALFPGIGLSSETSLPY
jgi:hypothetical protein